MKDPSKLSFNEDIAEEICERMATHPGADGALPRVLAALRAEGWEGVPSERTFYYWRAHRPEFREMYREAREMQGELDIDQALIVATEPNRGQIVITENKGGKGDKGATAVKTVKIIDNVDRSRLIVAALWQRAKAHNKALAETLQIGGTIDIASKLDMARKRVTDLRNGEK